MKKQHLRISLISLAALAFLSAGHAALRPAPGSAYAAAQAAPAPSPAPVLLHLSVEKRTVGADADGKPRVQWIALAGPIRPGDTLRYLVQAQNGSKTAIQNLTVTQPVPAGTVYLAGSAETPVLFSADGKQFSAQPTEPARQPDGTIKQQPVAPEAYVALRWQLPALPAGSAQAVSYQVKVR